MRGRDLIIYILANNLEDEKMLGIKENGKIIGFMNKEEAAVKFGVGVATIDVWIELDQIPSFEIAGYYYIPENAQRPHTTAEI